MFRNLFLRWKFCQRSHSLDESKLQRKTTVHHIAAVYRF